MELLFEGMPVLFGLGPDRRKTKRDIAEEIDVLAGEDLSGERFLEMTGSLEFAERQDNGSRRHRQEGRLRGNSEGARLVCRQGRRHGHAAGGQVQA